MSLLETNRYLDGPTDIVGLKVARKRLKTEISAIGALAVKKQKKEHTLDSHVGHLIWLEKTSEI